MTKEDLKKRLEETKAKLKANSKDPHFADALICDLLSLKGQLGHEPTMVHIPLSDVVEELKGDTFEMAVTKKGDAIYHVYGGYTIIADPRLIGLNSTIRNYIASSNKTNEGLDEDEQTDIELDFSATRYVLSAPMFAFSSPDIKFQIATDIVKWLNDTAEDLLNRPLQEDDEEANIAFEKDYKERMAAAEAINNIDLE